MPVQGVRLSVLTVNRVYKTFTHKEAVFRICCDAFDSVTEEIVNQRQILEDYIKRHPEFQHSLKPIELLQGAPEAAQRMARAADITGIGPMAAVAGTMAQLAARAGFKAGASEAIIENGGDIYVQAEKPVTIGLLSGSGGITDRLAFSLKASDTPVSICSSSGKMGHSMSMGNCDLAAVTSKDASLADAAATLTANLVKQVADVDPALKQIHSLQGVIGVLIVKDDRIGLAGNLPQLVKTR
jgi:ApbE superfamily uncharacterized protein (UPF0280 family)